MLLNHNKIQIKKTATLQKQAAKNKKKAEGNIMREKSDGP